MSYEKSKKCYRAYDIYRNGIFRYTIQVRGSNIADCNSRIADYLSLSYQLFGGSKPEKRQAIGCSYPITKKLWLCRAGAGKYISIGF